MLKNLTQLLRIPQWIKNFFVFVPLLFSLHLFEASYFLKSLYAFVLFSLSSSLIYVFNDIIDVKSDAAHPVKKFRPLPSGKIKISTGWIITFILFLIVVIASLNLPVDFNYFLFGFIALNVIYSLLFKHIVLLDIFSIAAGFTIRVLAGAVIISVPVSSWLILTTMFISLFLGVMKRHSELVQMADVENHITRKVLSDYSTTFTNQMATVAAAGVIICYALYTVAQRTVQVFGTENLIYTTPFVVFGIFRFMYLEYLNKKGENTTQIMLSDVQMIVTVLLYVLVTVLIVYKII